MKLFSLSFLFGLTFALTGCLQTRTQVEEAEERKQVKESVSSLSKLSADSVSRVDVLESEFRQMNGKLETADHKMQILNETQKKDTAITSARVEELAKRIEVAEEALLKLEKRVQDAELAALSSNSNKAATADKPEKGTFAEAEENYDKKNWKRAISLYQKFRESNPKSSKNAEATYKIGVSFQELGMKNEAKIFFEEVLEKYPKDTLARKAQFRLSQLKK